MVLSKNTKRLQPVAINKWNPVVTKKEDGKYKAEIIFMKVLSQENPFDSASEAWLACLKLMASGLIPPGDEIVIPEETFYSIFGKVKAKKLIDEFRAEGLTIP